MGSSLPGLLGMPRAGEGWQWVCPAARPPQQLLCITGKGSSNFSFRQGSALSEGALGLECDKPRVCYGAVDSSTLGCLSHRPRPGTRGKTHTEFYKWRNTVPCGEAASVPKNSFLQHSWHETSIFFPESLFYRNTANSATTPGQASTARMMSRADFKSALLVTPENNLHGHPAELPPLTKSPFFQSS